ncbi:hypothetical protein ACQP2Y_21715 [Actinoplanes sp. CA-051413]|uniref:hypothetical protein n=1 Tax=Actinoplanes sp. CA-051413 TaxID=3239899 RepID=UPI003D9563FB
MTAETVTHKAVKQVSCGCCGRGKKLRRTKTFTAVLEPGETCEAALVRLEAAAEEWTPTGAHPPCQCPYFTDPQ